MSRSMNHCFTASTLLLATALVFAAPQVRADTFEVTTTEDSVDGVCDSHCSLRDAVVAANATPGRDHITIPSGTFVLEIDGRGEDSSRQGDLDILETVVIQGAGRSATIIDGGEVDRVFHVHPPEPGERSVEIHDLGITGGLATGFDRGGGVLNDGTLALSNVSLNRNQATGSCGSGGGIANDAATLSLEFVVIAENVSACDGGGLWNRAGTIAVAHSELRSNESAGDGGGMYSDAGTISIVQSTIAGNIAHGDGVKGGGAMWARASTLLVQGSTISSNSSSAHQSSYGGGLWADACTITLLNSTLSENWASGASSSAGGAVASRMSTVVISSCTLTKNSAESGSSVWSENSTITATNTLVDGECALTLPLFSGGGNMESPGDTCRFNAPSDNPSTPRSALRLGALDDNGGTTRTHALLPGSAALDSGVNWACPARDQRGVRRPIDGTGDGQAICDVGAFEAESGGAPTFSTWLPIAAHSDGAGGSRWRTDMAVLNRSQADTELELVFHSDDDSAELDAVLPRSAQIVFDDVVGRFGLDRATGVIEIRSSQPVVVSSRTANHTVQGTLGQYVGGITVDQGLDTGETALLPQLSQSETATTNLVLSNTGETDASVEIRLYDDFGWKHADLSVTVPAARVHLIPRLFTVATGRGGSGWAEVELVSGHGLIAFASVIDRRSGDPTTIPMQIQGR